MRLKDTGAGILSRAYKLFYSFLIKMRVRSWGRNSRILAPATIIGGGGITVGERVTIREHAWLNARSDWPDGRSTLTIGDGVYIGRFVQINAWSEVEIESDVLVGDRVYISDAEHHFENREIPVLLQGDFFKGPVRLRTGCWIGIGAVILPGVTVGKNAVVAANAVVRCDVPDYTVVGGVPARILREI